MPPDGADIVVIDSMIEKDELSRLVNRFFGDMVKFVVDVRIANKLIGKGEAL